ncbi:MAG: hypothetical protein ABFD07_03360 [Methanobacterium sp.]
MKTINVILIDVDTKTICKVKIDDVESLEFKMKWCRLMGSSEIDEVLYPNRDSMRICGDNLMNPNPEKFNYFSFNGSDVFPGNGMIVGMTNRGEPTDVHMSVDEIQSMVKYHNHYDLTEQFN